MKRIIVIATVFMVAGGVNIGHANDINTNELLEILGKKIANAPLLNDLSYASRYKTCSFLDDKKKRKFYLDHHEDLARKSGQKIKKVTNSLLDDLGAKGVHFTDREKQIMRVSIAAQAEWYMIGIRGWWSMAVKEKKRTDGVEAALSLCRSLPEMYKHSLKTVERMKSILNDMSEPANTVSEPFSTPNYDAGVAADRRRDYETTLKHFRPLAEQGDARAQLFLGSMYQNGKGITKDIVAAVSWYRKAAKQGHSQAQTILGWMLAYGKVEGVKKNAKEAVSLFRKAAGQGDFFAYYNLGKVYMLGIGVKQDNIMAFVWYDVAGENGHGLGIEKRDTVAKLLGNSDLDKALKLSKLCLKEPMNCPEYSDE